MIMVTCSTIISTAGCRSLRPALEIHDTTIVERTITIHDTVFKTAPASVRTTLAVPCPDQFKKDFKPSSNRNKNATVKTSMVGDSLQIDCECDTIAIRAQLKNIYEKTDHNRTEVATRTVENNVPGFVKFLAWSGGIFWVLILIAVFGKIFLKR